MINQVESTHLTTIFRSNSLFWFQQQQQQKNIVFGVAISLAFSFSRSTSAAMVSNIVLPCSNGNYIRPSQQFFFLSFFFVIKIFCIHNRYWTSWVRLDNDVTREKYTFKLIWTTFHISNAHTHRKRHRIEVEGDEWTRSMIIYVACSVILSERINKIFRSNFSIYFLLVDKFFFADRKRGRYWFIVSMILFKINEKKC